MIEVRDLTLHQGDFCLRNVSITVPDGKYGVLMGPSGCGKTTLLEAICGLRPIAAGNIRLGGVEVNNLPPGARGIGYVPQDAALFPKLRVRDQLAFGLVLRNRSDKEIADRVDELAELLRIGHLLDRLPHGLSGGERQRVAFGRALAINPPILCLDEPLSALDDDTHDELLALIKGLRHHVAATTLHVTHSRKEAKALADVVLTLG